MECVTGEGGNHRESFEEEMTARRDIIVVSAAGLLGLAGGLLYGSDAEEIRKENEVSIPPRRASRNEIARGEARSYETLRRRVKNGGIVPKSGADFLSSAGRDEIFAEMEALAASYNPRNGMVYNIHAFRSLKAAARELYRRDGVAAVESAEKNKASMRVLSALIKELCRVNPELAGPYRKRFFERFGVVMGTDFALAEMSGAAARSADEFLTVEKNYSGYPLDGEYADDFDFRRYVSASKSSTGIVSAMQYWSASDPDAAAESLLKGDGSEADGGQFLGALNGRAAMAGEDAAAKWIVGTLAQQNEQGRSWAVRGFATADPSLERVEALLKHLPDEKSRIGFAAALVGMSWRNKEGVMFLAENQPEEFRIRVAEAWLVESRHRDFGDSEKMMEDLQIPEPKRQALRAMK